MFFGIEDIRRSLQNVIKMFNQSRETILDNRQNGKWDKRDKVGQNRKLGQN